MVFFNYSTMQMTAKVVYYGPGLCGKTTNLQFIYGHTANDSRGEMVSLETETDRTLFFDLLPIDVGTIGGFSTRIQLYTVPGQVFYNTTRKLVLKGVDGVVFVADSQKPMLQANADSWKNLEENLAEMGLAIDSIPVVLQYNKRDLPDVSPIDELNQAINPRGLQHFEASAVTGQGVFETLKGISKLTLLSLKKRLTKIGEGGSARPTATVRAAPVPAAPAASLKARPTPPPPAARPAPAPPVKAAKGGRSSKLDVLAELEKIRKQALSAPGTGDTGARTPRSGPHARAGAAGSGAHPRAAQPTANGNGEIHRSVEFTLNRAEFHRARRFLLDLRVEDADAKIVDAIRDIPIDISDPSGLERLLLHLNVALNVALNSKD